MRSFAPGRKYQFSSAGFVKPSLWRVAGVRDHFCLSLRKSAEPAKSPDRPGVQFVAPRPNSQYLLPIGESFGVTNLTTSFRRRPCRSSRRAELRKHYGRIRALKGVSLRVEKGQIYGLLGQNGAGKTTLIKILLGIAKKTDGEAELLGRAAGTTDVRRRVGYLPEDHQFPGYHTGYSLMDFYGALYGVSKDDRRKKIPETLELVGIAGRMNSKIKTYSKGMKQRLGIAQSLLHDPEVIFLDEPTDGVDPLGRREIRELMGRLKDKGHTLFLNSHLLGEVELICDRVAILQQGELIREGTIHELTKQKGQVEIGLAPGRAIPRRTRRMRSATRRGNARPRTGRRGRTAAELWEVSLADGQTIDRLVRLVFEKGLHLRHMIEKKQSLEDVFLATVEAAEPGVDRKERQGRGRGGERTMMTVLRHPEGLVPRGRGRVRHLRHAGHVALLILLSGACRSPRPRRRRRLTDRHVARFTMVFPERVEPGVRPGLVRQNFEAIGRAAGRGRVQAPADHGEGPTAGHHHRRQRTSSDLSQGGHVPQDVASWAKQPGRRQRPTPGSAATGRAEGQSGARRPEMKSPRRNAGRDEQKAVNDDQMEEFIKKVLVHGGMDATVKRVTNRGRGAELCVRRDHNRRIGRSRVAAHRQALLRRGDHRGNAPRGACSGSSRTRSSTASAARSRC